MYWAGSLLKYIKTNFVNKGERYIDTLYDMLNPEIEPVYYKMALVLFVVIIICNKMIPEKICKGKRVFCLALMLTYIFLVIASTILSRTSSGIHRYELMPFWSYVEIIKNNNAFIFWEVVLNILMMVPVGFMTVFSFNRITIKGVVIMAFLIEAFIEGMQLILCRGLAEWDDIIHGMIGAAVGYGMALAVRTCVNYMVSNRY